MATTDVPPRPVPAAVAKSWPGPRGHWFWGCMRQVQNDPLTLYTGAWRQYGDYVRIHLLPRIHYFLLAHPDAVEHVLGKNHKNYRKPDVVNKPVSLLAGNGILTSEGDVWLRQRRLIQPAFLRHHLIELSAQMVQSIDRLLAEWEQAGPERTIDVAQEMMRLALRIASTTLFRTDVSADADVIGRAFRETFAYVSRRMNSKPTWPLWVPTRRNRQFNRAKEQLDQVVLRLIEYRRRTREVPRDLLDLLLAAQDPESGTGMTNRQLKDEALTLLTAGHETVGAALSWAWYLLGKHPAVQEDLHDEVAARMQGRTPTMKDLPHLPLATAVFEESMRLYPPAWGLPREAIRADEINGYPVPARSILTLSQWLIHRHPDFWKDPDRFDPGRFLPANSKGRPKYAYFPFGGGPRVCVGNTFAMIEGPLALAAIAQRFRITLAGDREVVPDATFTLRPRDGVLATVRGR